MELVHEKGHVSTRIIFVSVSRGGNKMTHFYFFIVSKAQILILGIKKTYKLIIRIRVENSTCYGHF